MTEEEAFTEAVRRTKAGPSVFVPVESADGDWTVVADDEEKVGRARSSGRFFRGLLGQVFSPWR